MSKQKKKLAATPSSRTSRLLAPFNETEIQSAKKTHYLTLDTNTWIYLANGMEPAKLLKFIETSVESGAITLLVPETVISEWHKNKDHAVKEGAIKHFKGITNSLDRILKLLGAKGETDIFSFLLGDKKEDDSFEGIVDKFNQKRKEVESAIAENINAIDNLFKNKKIKIIQIKDEVILKAGKFAVDKKAPFLKKNSFADALILFSFIDYTLTHSIKEAIFISYNSEDFCLRRDGQKLLHPDLMPEFASTKSVFFHIVGEALRSIEESILSLAELQSIKEIHNDFLLHECSYCSDNLDRYTPIYFEKVDLIDQRLLERIDPNQLPINFTNSQTQRRELPKNYNYIMVATCDYCNTEHFFCVKCMHLNAVMDTEYDERKECENCELPYLVERIEGDVGAPEESTYTILKDITHCYNCRKEFDSTDPDQEFCRDCQELRNTYAKP